MKLTVQDLIDMHELDFTRVMAGASGLARPVLWAHSCEMADPWTWLGRNELLMTIGLSMPQEPEAQVRFIEYLDAGGLSGMVLGPGPERMILLQDETLERANELGFPIVTLEGMTPFTVVARVVAIASTSDQVARVTRLNRLYERARLTSPGDAAMLDRLAEEVGYALHVLDVDYGTQVLPASSELEEATIQALHRATSDSAPLPARLRVEAEGQEVTAFTLPGPRRCMMIVGGAIDLDALIMQHTLSLVSVEYERIARERERRDRSGETLLLQLLDGTMAVDEARFRLGEAGLSPTAWRLAAFSGSALEAARYICGDQGIPSISASVADTAFLLFDAAATQRITDLTCLHSDATGYSAVAAETSRLRDAAREARWALEAARTQGLKLAEYTSSAPLFLPQTVEEARFAARVVLSSLIDHDQAHGTELVRTLRVFLDEERSWVAAAEKLQIHRQTLGYRIKKIESLTGRSTRASKDLAFLWMALAALEITGGSSHD